jgi:hypothetical protein
VTIVNDQGEMQEVTVMLWNETIANLSLMALGSSAPEIMLAVLPSLLDLCFVFHMLMLFQVYQPALTLPFHCAPRAAGD